MIRQIITHNHTLNQEDHEFESYKEFMQMKAKEEEDTQSFYVQQSGSNVHHVVVFLLQQVG